MQRARIKVLLYTVSLGGVRQHIEDIVQQIDHTRFEVIGAFPDRLLNRTYLPDPEGGYRAMFAKAGLATYTVETPTGMQPLACATAARDMGRLLRAVRPDVLHCHSSIAGAIGRLASLTWRPGRVFYTPHLMFHLRLTGARRRIFATLERMLLPLCDALIAVSASEHREIAATLGNSPKILTIPNAIPSALAAAPPPPTGTALPPDLVLPEGKTIILSTARFDSQKDVATLVRAAGLLAARRRDFVVLLAGDGEERQRIASLIRHEGVSDLVRLLGWRTDAQRLVAACDIMALSSRREGLPYALLEAMALEKPVVGSDVPGVRDCIDPGVTGLLFPCGDAHALARALDGLLEDPARRHAMGLKGREWALRRFSPQVMLDALEALYAQAAPEGRDNPQPSPMPRAARRA